MGGAPSPLRPTIKDLPPDVRPRERLIGQGPAALSLTELVGLLLETGNARTGATALDLAAQLLSNLRARYKQASLAAISFASLEEIRDVPGIGSAKGARLLAAVELGRRLAEVRPTKISVDTPEEVARWLHPRMRDYDREHFIVIWLDTKHHVLGHETVSVGGLCNAPAHPREVFKGALLRSAAAVVLAHNHPSGDPTPSPDDVRLTRRLVNAGGILGIDVVDHIVLGADCFTSMRESGVGFS